MKTAAAASQQRIALIERHAQCDVGVIQNRHPCGYDGPAAIVTESLT